MTIPRCLAIGALLVGMPLAHLHATTDQVQQAPPAQAPQTAAPAQSPPGQAPRATPPRGRSITLGDVTNAEMKDSVFTVTAGQDVARVIFYRNDIFRIWLGPDGTFTEAQPSPEDAQIVLFKGPAIPVAWRDAGDYYRLDSQTCVLRVYKKPLRFALFDRDNVSVVWQESRALTYGPTTTQTLKRGETEHFYGGGMQNIVDAHIPAKPASVKLADRALPEIAATGTDRAARDKQRADCAAAAEGWYFDATDRRGVLHVKIKPHTLAAGWVLKVTQ